MKNPNVKSVPSSTNWLEMDTEMEAEMLHDTDKLNQSEKTTPTFYVEKKTLKLGLYK